MTSKKKIEDQVEVHVQQRKPPKLKVLVEVLHISRLNKSVTIRNHLPNGDMQDLLLEEGDSLTYDLPVVVKVSGEEEDA